MSNHPDISFRPMRVDNPDIANAARIYDYLLDGSLNTKVDRDFAEDIVRRMPSTRECVRNNRGFATRAVRYAAERGVRQFLDLGAGIPSAGGLHKVAEEVDPHFRWVGVDNEAVAVAAGELATEGDDRVAFVYADLATPAKVLNNPTVRATIDFSKEVLVILAAAMHFVGDDRDPYGVVRAYRDATTANSLIALSHGTTDDPSVQEMNAAADSYSRTRNGVTVRSFDQVRRFADGYAVVEPGIVLTADWRPDGLRSAGTPAPSGAYAFVGVRQ